MVRAAQSASAHPETLRQKLSLLLTVKSLTQRRIRILALALLVLGATTLCAWAFWVPSSRVPYGSYLADQNLGALDWSDAKGRIVQYAERVASRPRMWVLDSKSCAFVPKDAGIRIDVEATLKTLANDSRKRGFWSRGFGRSAELIPEIAVDENAFSAWAEQCEAKVIANRPQLGRLVAKEGARDGSMLIEPSKAGQRIDVLRMKKELPRALVRLDDSSHPLPLLKVAAFPPQEALDRATVRARELAAKPFIFSSASTGKRLTLLRSELAKLFDWRPNAAGELAPQLLSEAFDSWIGSRRHRVEQRARNATYKVEGNHRLVLVPEEPGQRIALDQLREAFVGALLAGQRLVEIPFEPTEEPKLRQADIERLNIRELVGTFTTRYACCQARVHNIHRIAELVDGAIVLPGATFDVNEYTGQRTLDNGFIAAKSIQDGEMTDAIGGGICQFATTLYNAVMRSGYEILERQAHSYWFDKYPMGHEATLSWPKPNLVLRNDTASGLLILVSYDKTSITVKLYGDQEGRRVSWGVSGRSDIVLPKTEYLPNFELEPDKEKIKEGGCIGWTVTTTRKVTLKDGTVREDKRKIIYKPRLRRVEVHPCKIPAGEPGATGEKCPKVEEPIETAEGVSPATAE